jgi:hypothetical protein
MVKKKSKNKKKRKLIEAAFLLSVHLKKVFLNMAVRPQV